MRINGSHAFRAPRGDVYAAICDPAVLMAVIPGCESIEQVSPTEYRGVIALRLPGFGGRYRTSVSLVDAVPDERAGMEGGVDGAFGSIRGRADFVLSGDGSTTRIDYAGEAVIDGPLARLDSRFAESLAQSLISQGLAALDRRLPRQRSVVAASATGVPSTEVSE